MVTGEVDREDCSPEMTAMEVADGFKTLAGNSKYAGNGEAYLIFPGFECRIELDSHCWG